MKIKQGSRITVAFHTRLLSCLLFLLCPVISALASGEYRTVEIESLRITIDAEWATQGAPGYLPVRFDITNLGEAREIEIIGQGSRWFETVFGFVGTTGGSPEIGSVEVREALRLKRGDRLRLTMPVPVFAGNENIQFQIRERGRTLQTFNYSGFRSGKSLEEAPALIVADSRSAFGITAQSWLRPAPSPGYSPPGRAAPPLDFILDPARLPAN